MNFPVATDKMTSWPGRAIIDTSKGIPPFIGRYAEITGVRIKKNPGKTFYIIERKKGTVLRGTLETVTHSPLEIF